MYIEGSPRMIKHLRLKAYGKINLALDVLGPVSYTHLDVYKRQVQLDLKLGCIQDGKGKN